MDMITGISWALVAGIMLGLYALPAKFTKDFGFENTWGLFFFLTMFLVPIIATLVVMKGVGEVFSSVPGNKLTIMIVASFLWGTGVMMWGKAIDYIGVSLGFSLFIGTVILIGSLLPFFVDGLPPTPAFISIIIGLLVVLFGIFSNGKAGIMREKDEVAANTEEAGNNSEKKSVSTGITIAIVGGLLATLFSLADLTPVNWAIENETLAG